MPKLHELAHRAYEDFGLDWTAGTMVALTGREVPAVCAVGAAVAAVAGRAPHLHPDDTTARYAEVEAWTVAGFLLNDFLCAEVPSSERPPHSINDEAHSRDEALANLAVSRYAHVDIPDEVLARIHGYLA